MAHSSCLLHVGEEKRWMLCSSDAADLHFGLPVEFVVVSKCLQQADAQKALLDRCLIELGLHDAAPQCFR